MHCISNWWPNVHICHIAYKYVSHPLRKYCIYMHSLLKHECYWTEHHRSSLGQSCLSASSKPSIFANDSQKSHTCSPTFHLKQTVRYHHLRPVELQKKFLMSGVTSFTHSFTWRSGWLNVELDTCAELWYKPSCSCCSCIWSSSFSVTMAIWASRSLWTER